MTAKNEKKTLSDIRQNINQAIADNDAALAKALMAELWASFPGPATAPLILSGFEALNALGSFKGSKSLDVSILRSFSVEPIVPILKAAGQLEHINLNLTIGEFNTYAQEIISPDSLAYSPETDVVLLAVQTRDIAPDLWHGKNCDRSMIEQVIADYAGFIKAFRSRSDAYLVIHNFEQPAWPALGLLDAQSRDSQRNAISEINAALIQIASEYNGIFILDYDSLVSRHGRETWCDEGRWLTMRLPVAMENLHHMANEWLRFLAPLSGRMAKALIVDLDNTLWGGVLGEDGLEGIRLDGEYPGAAYQAVQRAVLDLADRGIILGICSKNDEEGALKALRDLPGMILTPENFSIHKINWQDKASNIKAIADELNIGTDAIAFLDDNPAERLWVRQSLPEVTVIELSDDPLTYVDALRGSVVFERLSVSEEDKQRGRHYAEQRQRKNLQDTTASLEDFYASLETKLDVFPVGAGDITRVSQLSQKTNQFNLTSRRYSEADISNWADSPSHMVFAARVSDRFGDSGIISVVIVEIKNEEARLDTFLMSCRVIGRTVETAILAIVAGQLKERGVKNLLGEFIPTEKNSPAKDFLVDHGFDDKGNGEFMLNLLESSLQVPTWIKA